MGPRGRLLGSIRVSIIHSFIRSLDAVVRSRGRGYIGSSYKCPSCLGGAIGANVPRGRDVPPGRNAKGVEHGLDYTGSCRSLRRHGSDELFLRRGLISSIPKAAAAKSRCWLFGGRRKFAVPPANLQAFIPFCRAATRECRGSAVAAMTAWLLAPALKSAFA
jgi:hypothetical protein